MVIKYTLAFIKDKDNILLLKRKNKPNQHMWNGLGGKIENGENHFENINRELLEEAGIELNATENDYRGLITWNLIGDNNLGGAHLFIFDITDQNVEVEVGDTREGLLEWKNLDWVCDLENKLIVNNIPMFFPTILKSDINHTHHFEYSSKRTIIEYLVRD